MKFKIPINIILRLTVYIAWHIPMIIFWHSAYDKNSNIVALLMCAIHIINIAFAVLVVFFLKNKKAYTILLILILPNIFSIMVITGLLAFVGVLFAIIVPVISIFCHKIFFNEKTKEHFK